LRRQNLYLMTQEERIKKQKELIEKLGRHYGKKGFQPTAGRIIGLLIVMDKERFTFDEIVEELKISKSSASVALQILEMRDVVDYITIPGERKRYFQIKRMDRFALIDEHRNKLRTSRDFIQAVIDLKSDQMSENTVFLKNITDMLDFFLFKFDELKKEYIANKQICTGTV
jgi:DNA-binding transcriptional regulator GbsR (MarR family)